MHILWIRIDKEPLMQACIDSGLFFTVSNFFLLNFFWKISSAALKNSAVAILLSETQTEQGFLGINALE